MLCLLNSILNLFTQINEGLSGFWGFGVLGGGKVTYIDLDETHSNDLLIH